MRITSVSNWSQLFTLWLCEASALQMSCGAPLQFQALLSPCALLHLESILRCKHMQCHVSTAHYGEKGHNDVAWCPCSASTSCGGHSTESRKAACPWCDGLKVDGMPHLSRHSVQANAYLLHAMYEGKGKYIVHYRGCNDHRSQHKMHAAVGTVLVITEALGGRYKYACSQNEVCNK
jgi:hypothetical protein